MTDPRRKSEVESRGPGLFGFPAFGLRPSTPTAFTLLEVLCALAIFAFAAVVMGATYINVLVAYEAVGRRTDYNEDIKFVRTALLTEPDRTNAEAGGDLDLGEDRRARWSAEIEPTETADLFAVTWTCEITDPGRSTPYKTSWKFMLLRPTWSEGVERDELRAQSRERILKIQEQAR